jgi:hypothetical protein
LPADLSALQDFADEDPGFDLLDEDEPASAYETAPIDVREPAVPARRQPTAAPARTGESFQSMRSRLGKWDALTPFANQQGQIYARNRLAGTCPCGNTDDPGVCSARWKGRAGKVSLHWASLITILVGRIVTRTKWRTVEFTSYHRLCRGCYRWHRLMKFAAICVRIASVFIGLIALVVALVAASEPRGAGAASSTFVIGSIIVVVSVAGWLWGGSLRVPPSIRQVRDGPFRLKKITMIG